MGRSPLLTLGPSWPFTFVLLMIGGMIFTYFMLMLNMGDVQNGPMLWLSYTTIAINVYMLFGGILKNPGIV